MITALVVAISIFGAFLVSFEKAYYANLLWCVSNPPLIWHNYRIGELEQVAMFAIFFLFAFFGVLMHRFPGIRNAFPKAEGAV